MSNYPPGAERDPRAPWNEREGCYREGCDENAVRGHGGFCSELCRDMYATGHDGTEPCECVECEPEGAVAKAWHAKERARVLARFAQMRDALAARANVR